MFKKPHILKEFTGIWNLYSTLIRYVKLMLLFEVTKPRLFDGFNFFLLTWEIWFINNFLNSTYCLVYITPISMYQAFVLRVPLESKEILKWCALFSPWYSIHYKQNTIFLKAIFFNSFLVENVLHLKQLKTFCLLNLPVSCTKYFGSQTWKSHLLDILYI